MGSPSDWPVPATLIYLFRDDQVLLLRRNKKAGDTHQGKYVGLGGKLAPGESLLECAVREVYEESGFILEPSSLCFRGHLNCPGFDRKGRDWLVFVYSCHQFSGNQTSVCQEGELVWVDRSKIQSFPMWEGDYRFLNCLLAGENFDMTVRYEGEALKECRLNILAQAFRITGPEE
ncbi:MAG: 8-oxo-dGTP diphosphatase [Deltaproteobacteria bacterium]|nr:8-oxo-dGTP diphosphatase [Deltaproteobacteria bacterium]